MAKVSIDRERCKGCHFCIAVCPKKIPLSDSIARAGRAATIHAFRKWFER